jgi:hypothetical protein
MVKKFGQAAKLPDRRFVTFESGLSSHFRLQLDRRAIHQALWNGDVRVAFNGDFWPNVLERASRKAAPVLISINRSLP